MSRRTSVDIQSPGLPTVQEQAGKSYSLQLNKIVDKESEAELYKVLSKQPKEHALHIAILETLAPLFENIDEVGQGLVRQYINQDRAIGNHIRNLINVPDYLHQGGIHTYARNKGYEIPPSGESTGIAKEILEVSKNGSIKDRQRVANKYLKQAIPDMENYINDSLTKHYKRAEAKSRVQAYAMTDSTLPM